MKLYTSLLTFTLCACANPVINGSTLDENVDEKDSPSSEENEGTNSNDTQDETDSNNNSDDNGSDNTPEDDGSDNGSNGGSSTYTLESNTWYATDATMIEDSCAWDAPLRQFFGIGSDALLPESFTVQGFEGSFEIEANSYGASGPITCGFQGTEFECETQSVTPLAFDLGTYGWTYAIDFNGTAISEDSLFGVAEVRFPTISDWLIPIFQSSGIDYTQCVQSFELSLSVN